ncbi:hypothetical protein BGZ74_005604, partial [Mortierella antarctica]
MDFIASLGTLHGEREKPANWAMRQWAKHLLNKSHPQAPVTREVTHQRPTKRTWSEVASSGQRGSSSHRPPQPSGTRSAPSSKKMTCTWKPCKDLKD